MSVGAAPHAEDESIEAEVLLAVTEGPDAEMFSLTVKSDRQREEHAAKFSFCVET